MLLDGKDNVRYKTFSRRAALIGGLQLAAFGALTGRMYYLQILKSDEYAMLAEENRISKRLLAPLRGEIVDRFGTVLASNRQNFRVMLVPEQTRNIETTLDKLSRIIPLAPRQRARIISDAKRSPSFMPILVAENLEWEVFAEVNLHEPDLPGIVPDVGDTRHYPFERDLAHVVGYVAAVSERDLEEQVPDPLLKLPGFRIGKSGIERELDKKLRGRAGASHVEVNAYGRVIREIAKDPGVPGAQVSLTLDMEVQKTATEKLVGQSGSVVVMDIHNGDVISLVSSPGFDPNDFNVGISQKKWNALLQDPYNPLLNKAIAGQYPPGSTFKMVVALAAYESGVDPNQTVFCNGKYSLGSHDFHCWRRQGHGAMRMHDAIMHSCDIYFYDVARRIGIERIAEMARRFGLGDSFDFDVPGERTGLVPSREWKRAVRGEPWHQGETLIAGIGQGYLLATPLQLAVMTARISNGGKAVTPRIVRALDGEVLAPQTFEEIPLPQAGLDLVKRGMNSVSNVPGGTAYRSRIPEEGMHLAGKTGTAQVRRITRAERESRVLTNEELDWRQRDHALFVAFAPVHAPRYAISVVVEHGMSGSGTAAPIARDVMRKVLERHPEREIAMRRANEGREG